MNGYVLLHLLPKECNALKASPSQTHILSADCLEECHNVFIMLSFNRDYCLESQSKGLLCQLTLLLSITIKPLEKLYSTVRIYCMHDYRAYLQQAFRCNRRVMDCQQHFICQYRYGHISNIFSTYMVNTTRGIRVGSQHYKTWTKR